MIPEVRYGPWQADRRKAPEARVRALSCSRCGAILARQTSVDEAPLDADPSAIPPLKPYATYCLPDLILLPELASVSSPDLPVYGVPNRQRRGKTPRPIARHEVGPQMVGGVVPREDWFNPDRTRGNTVIRSARWRVRLEPVAFDCLPGEGGLYLPSSVRVPCELFCVNCHSRHLLSGRTGLEAEIASEPTTGRNT